MNQISQKAAGEARNEFLELLQAAECGQSTIITRQGRPVAALVPIETFESLARQKSILPLEGSGRSLWGKNSSRGLRTLRKEWDR